MKIDNLSTEHAEARDTGRRFYRDLSARMSLDPEDINTLQKYFDEACRGELNLDIAHMAIGIAFGEFLAKRAELEWVSVTDEYGEEIAVCHASAQLVVFPLSVINKRISAQDNANLDGLIDALGKSVTDSFKSGDYAPR